MIELFSDLSLETKQMITSYIDTTFVSIEPIHIPKLINDFVNSMPTQESQGFADFYFKLKLEELRNGSNNN